MEPTRTTRWPQPFLGLHGIRWADVPREVSAGITLAALIIPLNIGYAQVAGLPPVVGLYAAIIPLVVFALFTSSRHVVGSPDASIAALVGAALLEQGRHRRRHVQQHGHQPNAAHRRHGRQGEPAGGLDPGRQDPADHGNRDCQPDRKHRSGAGAFRRWSDAAMADGAAGGVGGRLVSASYLVGLAGRKARGPETPS